MLKNKRAAGLAAAGAGLALVVASIAVGGAVAEEADGVNEPATTAGSAAMKEQCTWFITGVQTAVTMDAGGAEYDGQALEMSAVPGALSVFYSGNEGGGTINAHSACTWFGAANADGITVNMSADGGDFTAVAESGADSGMDFSTGPDADAFVVDFTAPDCRSSNGTGDAWVVQDLVVAGEAIDTDVMDLTAANTTGLPSDAAGDNDACTSPT